MTLISNGAADAGVERDKTPNPARPMAILSTIGLRGIANPLLLVYWMKPNLFPEFCLWKGRKWITSRNHCCTDQAPGREEAVAAAVDGRSRCCTDRVEVVVGYTLDVHIGRKGHKHSLRALKHPRLLQRFFWLK